MNIKLPPGWHVIQEGLDGRAWRNNKKRLTVIASTAFEQDKREWLHISVVHDSRIPSYQDLCYVKRHFAGPERKCIQLFVPESEHVNIHPRCLHLFSCLDEDILPDFTWGTGSI